MGVASGRGSLPGSPLHGAQLRGRAHLQVALSQAHFERSRRGEAVVHGGSAACSGGCRREEGLLSRHAGNHTQKVALG